MGTSTTKKSLVFVFSTIVLFMIGIRQSQVKTHPRDIGTKVDERPKFTFDDIYSSDFSYKSVNPRWISGTKYIFMDSDRNVMIRDVETDAENQIMPGSVYTSNNARSYKVSADQKFIALLTNYKKGWRHSYNGTYLIYSVESGSLIADTKLPDDIQYFTWSPTESSLAYVTGFNIYYKSSADADPVQVTFDGRANHIYNGIPDWVYEEEMISNNNVIYFSPDGQYIAFAQFDDTECKHIQFSRYDEQKYPVTIDVSYPKAGTTQPKNKVFIYNIDENKTVEVEAPEAFTSGDYLFNRVTWANNSRAAVSWCNREQNWSIMRMCDINGDTITYTNSANFDVQSGTGWLRQRRPYWIPVFGKDETEFFAVRPVNNWQHLWRISKDGETPLTQGEYTVTSESASYPAVEIYDKATDHIYFSATKTSPQHRHIYRTVGSGDLSAEPQCVTCKLAVQYEGRCDAISTSFSTDGSYVIVRCGGDGPPLYAQYKIDHTATEEDNILTEENVLEDNEALVTKVAETQMSDKQYGQFESATGYKFTYQIWFPPNFDQNKKYPVLIDVYAGPGYQRVYAAWSRGWTYRFVPSSLDVIVASVDGRGSNYYGDVFMHEVYKKLGQKEPLDQLEFAKFLAGKPYVDSDRIAAWGWSYGGYATSLILGNDVDHTIKCGLAVAPLVDWRFYDTIYAERYMGLPDDNKDGYDKAAVLPLAEKFRDSSYYLIHGTADDNVHFQNAARLEHELVEKNVYFNDFFYADQDHSINVGNANQHVYKVLTRQLCQCFDIPVPNDVWN